MECFVVWSYVIIVLRNEKLVWGCIILYFFWEVDLYLVIFRFGNYDIGLKVVGLGLMVIYFEMDGVINFLFLMLFRFVLLCEYNFLCFFLLVK